jgi:hypothetical protein
VSLGASPTKNINIDNSYGKRSKRLKMCQGSIFYAHNPNFRPRSQPAKNRKYMHDPEKKCHRAQYNARTNIVFSKLSNESSITIS